MFEDEIDLVQTFEIQKRKISSDQVTPMRIRIPLTSFNEICYALFNEGFAARLKHAGLGEKVILKKEILFVHAEVFKQFFDSATEQIIDHVNNLLGRPTVSNCNHIIMVGGFSECEMLQEAIKKTCSAQKVIIPEEAGLMVLKGAVVFGHEPTVISQRISKYTYGTDVAQPFDPNKHPESKLCMGWFCKDIFCSIVEAGQSLMVGHPSEPIGFIPLFPLSTEMLIRLFAIKGKAPNFVTDDGCWPVGEIRVPMKGKDKHVEVRVILGGTELQVQCTYVATGEITQLGINFLD